jgi:DNA-binding protein YbaB
MRAGLDEARQAVAAQQASHTVATDPGRVVEVTLDGNRAVESVEVDRDWLRDRSADTVAQRITTALAEAYAQVPADPVRSAIASTRTGQILALLDGHDGERLLYELTH